MMIMSAEGGAGSEGTTELPEPDPWWLLAQQGFGSFCGVAGLANHSR